MRKFIAEKIFWETLKKWTKSSAEINKINFLKTVPFFGDLSHWQLKKVSEIVFERTYEHGELIFEYGQPGAALFLIEEGKVGVEIESQGVSLQLASLEKGAFFGEMALLDDSPRSASVRALEPTRTLALYRTDLRRLIHSDPQTACQIYQALARIVGDRLRMTNEMVQKESGAAPGKAAA